MRNDDVIFILLDVCMMVIRDKESVRMMSTFLIC
jgi:hypothetical protein